MGLHQAVTGIDTGIELQTCLQHSQMASAGQTRQHPQNGLSSAAKRRGLIEALPTSARCAS